MWLTLKMYEQDKRAICEVYYKGHVEADDILDCGMLLGDLLSFEIETFFTDEMVFDEGKPCASVVLPEKKDNTFYSKCSNVIADCEPDLFFREYVLFTFSKFFYIMRKEEVYFMPRNGTKNLIPASKRSKDEAKELGRKGGKKSGENRRKRKTLKEELLALLSSGDTQNKLSLALIQEALNGNNAGSVTRAFEVIRDTIGEKPVEKVVVAEVDQSIIDEVEKMVNDGQE